MGASNLRLNTDVGYMERGLLGGSAQAVDFTACFFARGMVKAIVLSHKFICEAPEVILKVDAFALYLFLIFLLL